MRYLCLGYHEEQTWEQMSPERRDALLSETRAYEALLRKSANCLRATALQTSRNAATLRFAGGAVSISDGPFAETKEQLGGVMLIEADDLNHAIQLMAQLPCMRAGGSLEIRPLHEELCSVEETDQHS